VSEKPESEAAMKRFFRKWAGATCLVVGVLVWAAGPAIAEVPPPAPEGKVHRVPWIKDESWEEIVERARSNEQPVLIDFTADWCGPCRLLDVMVFTEKTVIAELEEVVTFQVDIDKPEYAGVKENFAVDLLPTIVWCNSAGEEVDRFTSYRSSSEFLVIVRGWRQNRTIDRMLADRGAASPEDPAVLLDLARRHSERGQDHEADVLYRRLMNLRHKADTRTVARGFLGLAELEEKSGNPAKSDRLVKQAVDLYTGSELSADAVLSRTEGLMEIALFQESRGDTLGVLETYRTMVQLDDREVLGLDGFARTAVSAGVELEEATRCALRAMVFSDKDARIIGTLAETYYQRRLYSKAIRWINLSIERDPADNYYRDRLAAYEAAQDDASSGRYPTLH
jgi:thiol-disulfide isomerase/thioredoxin